MIYSIKHTLRDRGFCITSISSFDSAHTVQIYLQLSGITSYRNNLILVIPFTFMLYRAVKK